MSTEAALEADDRIRKDAVVQLDPSTDHAFGGCFMVVTERKSFGAQGYVYVPTERGVEPGRAYYRASWDQMTYVGHAGWVNDDD